MATNDYDIQMVKKEPKHHRHEKGTTILDLSNSKLSIQTCIEIAKELEKDQSFKEITLADGFSGDDGIIVFMHALRKNETCTKLDLRGNNIREDGTIAIAKLLKTNSTLQTLLLEWNCIGLWENGMDALANSLNMANITHLDLRNNKISPQGVKTIAEAVAMNMILDTLDLRWNHAGLVGGQALVDMMHKNKVIQRVETKGNEIPDELVRALEMALDRNHNDISHRKKHEMTETRMHKHLANLSKSHTDTLYSLTSTASSNAMKVKNLNIRLEHMEEELEWERTARTDAEEALIKLKAERDGIANQLSTLQSSAQVAHKAERRLQAQVDTQTDEIDDLTRKLKASEKRIRDMESQNDKTQRDVKEYEAELSAVQKRYAERNEEYLDKERKLDRDKRRLEDDADKEWSNRLKAVEQEWKTKLLASEKSNAALQQQVDAQAVELKKLAATFDERLSVSELRIRKEEHDRISELDAKNAQLISQFSSLEYNLTQAKKAEKDALNQLHKGRTQAEAIENERANLLAECQRWEGIATKMRSEEIMRMKQLERAIGQYVTSVDDGKEIESQRIRTRSLISDHNKLVS